MPTDTVSRRSTFGVSARNKALASRATANSPVKCLQSAGLSLTPYQESRILKRLENMPKNGRNGYVEAMAGKSRTAAIRAFCLECVGWERKEVGLCTAPACPLYPYRPVKEREA